jgi:hypothetical protein
MAARKNLISHYAADQKNKLALCTHKTNYANGTITSHLMRKARKMANYKEKLNAKPTHPTHQPT